MYMRISCLFVSAVFCAVCARAVTLEDIGGGNTALVVSGTEFTSEEKTALNANTVKELWKTGSSTLLAEGISSFAGDIRVKEGVFRLDNTSGWGTTAGKVYVTDGGVLYATVGDKDKEVHIAGEGNGKYTALVKTGNAMKLVMDANATISFIGNWRTYASSFNMNGYTITHKFCPDADRSEAVWPDASVITNPGHVVIDGLSSAGKKTALTFLHVSDQMQGTNHTFTVRNGNLDWYLCRKRTNWTLILENDASIGYNLMSGVPSNITPGTAYRWDGPVEIKEGKTLFLRPYCNMPVILGGNISGAGSVQLCCNVDNEKGMFSAAYLKGTNTYTGSTILDCGTMLFHRKESLPSIDSDDYSLSSNTSIALCLNGGDIDDAFTHSDAKETLVSLKTFPASIPLLLAAPDGVVTNFDYGSLSAGHTVPLGCYTNSAFGLGGTVCLNGVVPENAVFSVNSFSPARFTAPAGTVHGTKSVEISRGTAILEDFGYLPCNGYDISVGGTIGDNLFVPRLVLDGNTCIAPPGNASVSNSFFVGYGENKRGILEVREGAAITNRITNLGSGIGSFGALYQSGGEIYSTGLSNDRYWAVWRGTAFAEISGGKLTTAGWVHLGCSQGALAMYLSGGEYKADNNELQIGWGGTGVVYQTGGKFSTGSGSTYWLRVNSNNYCTDGQGMGVLAIADTAVATIYNKGILMAERSNGVAHVTLVNGGTLKTPILRRATKAGEGSSGALMPFPENCTAKYPSYVDFNGGVLCASSTGKILGERTDTEDTRPTDVLVYEGGAVFDSDKYTMTVDTPLKAPTGNGVASVELPEGDVCSGYLGAPIVVIEGDGEGAVAVALFDKASGTVTGIRVISPGRGYTTAKARFLAGGKSSTTNRFACTLAPNKSGPLEKRGSGTLVLNAANTYGGRTVLAGGVLKLGVEGALPEGSPVELAGGALNANGMASPMDWRLDFSKVTATGVPVSYPGSIAFPAGSKLTVENIDDAYLADLDNGFKLFEATGTVSGHPVLSVYQNPLWRLVWRNNALYMSSTRGTMILLK